MRYSLLISLLFVSACGTEDPVETVPADAGSTRDASTPDAGLRDTSGLPYARSVESFVKGTMAVFGHDRLPDIVFGPPGTTSGGGSLDVVSLGIGGQIVLGFGSRVITDGPGADFVVFENAFYAGGDPTKPFAELGEVSTSTDGQTWSTFPCNTAGIGEGRFPGCAGWTPTAVYDPFDLPLDPLLCGGNAFDLQAIGVVEARFVRVVDLATTGGPPSAGFDLDAIGLVHFREP